MTLPNLPLATPSLLFPAISLLMLAHTNRFLGLASVVRSLHGNWRKTGEIVLLAQIASLRTRLKIIKQMQVLGVLSIMMCIVSMGFIFFDSQAGGQLSFGLSLLLMLASLVLTLKEVQMSGVALDLHLQDVEKGGDPS